MTDAERRGPAASAGRRRRGRELALRVLFELEGTQNGAGASVEYHAEDLGAAADVAGFARRLVTGTLDHGADIDALKVVAAGVNSLRSAERSFVLVTHYQRLLDYIVPDYVHVLVRGRIARSGDRTLALELERRGYDWVTDEAA